MDGRRSHENKQAVRDPGNKEDNSPQAIFRCSIQQPIEKFLQGKTVFHQTDRTICDPFHFFDTFEDCVSNIYQIYLNEAEDDVTRKKFDDVEVANIAARKQLWVVIPVASQRFLARVPVSKLLPRVPLSNP
jgi:hypothetical protein